MPSTTGAITTDTLAALAQILPALLAIGILLPVLSRMAMPPAARVYFAGEALVIVATEGIILWQLIEGDPVDGGWRLLYWVACLYSLIGTMAIVIGWAASNRSAELAELEDRRADAEREDLDRRDAKIQRKEHKRAKDD
jgi:hypothetical protein